MRSARTCTALTFAACRWHNSRNSSRPSSVRKRFASLETPSCSSTTAAANWGYASRERGLAQLADPTVDLLICGEAREWEVVEYAQDAITAGQKKALIMLGHVVSEQGGMLWATEWLKTLRSGGAGEVCGGRGALLATGSADALGSWLNGKAAVRNADSLRE